MIDIKVMSLYTAKAVGRAEIGSTLGKGSLWPPFLTVVVLNLFGIFPPVPPDLRGKETPMSKKGIGVS